MTEILNLESELSAPREFVRIDGQNYDLRRGTELTLRLMADLKRLWARISDLENLEPSEVGEAEEAEYRRRLCEVARIAVPSITDEILEALPLDQLQAVATVFFVRVNLVSPMMRALQSIGEKSSAGSNGSTGADPATGSTLP